METNTEDQHIDDNAEVHVEEAETPETEEEQVNYSDMSDEELMNAPVPEETSPEEEEVEQQEEEESEETTEEETETETEAGGEAEPSEPEDTTDALSDDGEEVEVPKEDAEQDIDYKAAYTKVMAPFRANGKEIQVQNVEDVIHLMQMGANYSKKMAGLKPNLKLIKMLQNNDLLDESKLNYLIDLSKQDKGAINKLIKDSGIDPLEMDTETTEDYNPNTYNVNDSDVALDTVLSDIKDTDAYATTIEIISNKWDESSKAALYKDPSIIRTINDHITQGYYDKINAVMENERMLGRLQGMSDLDAYGKIGDALNAQGAFAEPQQNNTQATKKPAPVQKKQDNPQLKNRRKAASGTKASPNGRTNMAINPLAMSDEEFEKLATSTYM